MCVTIRSKQKFIFQQSFSTTLLMDTVNLNFSNNVLLSFLIEIIMYIIFKKCIFFFFGMSKYSCQPFLLDTFDSNEISRSSNVKVWCVGVKVKFMNNVFNKREWDLAVNLSTFSAGYIRVERNFTNSKMYLLVRQMWKFGVCAWK